MEKYFLPIKHRRALACLAMLSLVLSVVGVWYWWIFVYNPLISDKEMIDHFNTHREDFEEIIHRYRNFEVEQGVSVGTAWVEESGTQELMDEASIYFISQLTPDWIPDPYSSDSGDRYRELKKNKRYFSEFKRKHGSIALSFLHGTRSRNEARKNTLFFGSIWKEYLHIPEEPHVEDGYLYWPAYKKNSTGRIKKRVLNSLDRIPKEWGAYECVYRRLDAHWFLRMCNGR